MKWWAVRGSALRLKAGVGVLLDSTADVAAKGALWLYSEPSGPGARRGSHRLCALGAWVTKALSSSTAAPQWMAPVLMTRHDMRRSDVILFIIESASRRRPGGVQVGSASVHVLSVTRLVMAARSWVGGAQPEKGTIIRGAQT